MSQTSRQHVNNQDDDDFDPETATDDDAEVPVCECGHGKVAVPGHRPLGLHQWTRPREAGLHADHGRELRGPGMRPLDLAACCRASMTMTPAAIGRLRPWHLEDSARRAEMARDRRLVAEGRESWLVTSASTAIYRAALPAFVSDLMEPAVMTTPSRRHG